MRSRLVPFVVAAVCIGGAVILKNQFLSGKGEILRVASTSLQKIESYEPAKIHFAFEYILLENIYSTLVEIDPKDGRILPAIAESFAWIGNELHLKIRDDLRTASGLPITAKDVVFSLKRVILLAANTHGNFKDLVCPDADLKSISDACPGIEQRGNTVVLALSSKKTIIVPMLAAIDFAIIPEQSVDPKTLKILDYRETSGLYYVDHDDGKGRISLAINPSHFHASSDIASKVEFVPADLTAGETELDLLDKGAVDHVISANAGKIETLLGYAKTHPDVQIHATMKIRSSVLVFTHKGHSKLNLDQRRWLGKQIREAFLEAYASVPGYEEGREFFPALSEGGLTGTQRKKMDSAWEAAKEVSLPRLHISFLKSGNMDDWALPIKKRVPNLDITMDRVIPDLHTYANAAEVPDAFIANTDTGFMEDINLISYSLNAGYLGMEKEKRTPWLKHYMHISFKEERITALRDLHFKALYDADIVPLVVSPFVALAKKPWRMELSELYANNQLWLIKNH